MIEHLVQSEKFEDTEEVIRSRNQRKNRQCNGQKKKVTMTDNDLQNTTQKTKIELHKLHGCSRKVSCSCSTCDTRCVSFVIKPEIKQEGGILVHPI